MSFDARQVTAFHEAGHAVVAMALGRSIHKISIIPNKTRLGACEVKKGRFQPSNDNLEDEVLILFAGVAAEAKLTGKYDWNGAGQDLRGIRYLTLSRAGDVTRAEKLERRLLSKAEHLLADHDNWAAVVAIAELLVAKETIRGRSAMHIFRQSQRNQ